MPSFEVLTELRHTCKLCGGSCQGNYVRLIGDEETARLRDAADKLGVADPITDGRLRLEKGQCVFLGSDNLCRIHKELGGDVKPTVCKQYPSIAVRVEDTIRVGLDPGCYTAITTWKQGPLVEDGGLIATPVALDAGQRGHEEGLIDLCGLPDLTIARLLQPLTGEAPTAGGGLPPAFARRAVQCLQRANLPELLTSDDTAPMLKHTLRPIAEAVAGWDPERPPPWPAISRQADAYAVDAVQRMIYLRLAPKIPTVAGVALLTVLGAVAAGWSTESDEAFGRSLAGWCRAIRANIFWRALTPEAESMAWLARGNG